jgi:hypothetical protein
MGQGEKGIREGNGEMTMIKVCDMNVSNVTIKPIILCN